MTRIFDGFVALEMVLLWLLEFALCFLVFYVLLLPGDPGAAMRGLGPFGLHVATANHAVVLAITVGVISIAIGMYRPEICLQTRRLLVNSVVAGLLAFPAILLVSTVTDLDPSFIIGPDALWPMKILLSWILLLFITRLGFRVILRTGVLTRRVVIIGSQAQSARTEAAIRAMRRGFFCVVERIPVGHIGTLSLARLRQQRIWAVITTEDARASLPREPLLGATTGGVRVFDDVAFCEQQLRRMDLDHLPADWLLSADGLPCSRPVVLARRVADVAISLLILGFTLPVMLAAALAIRLDSPGPVFYRQERVGLGGRRFTLFKFRSMMVNAEADGPAWAARHDPRVTRFGALMRRTRVDELPQLLNVLRGEMSIVGPRPERPHFTDQLAGLVPFYRDRLQVKPGITGWAQVNFPYGASVEDARQKLSYDLDHVKHRSLLLDLLILLSTVRVILFQEGAR